MFQVMFFNELNRLLFSENREGLVLRPDGDLGVQQDEFPDSVTEFECFDDAKQFASQILVRYGTSMRATIRDKDKDEYHTVFLDE